MEHMPEHYVKNINSVGQIEERLFAKHKKTKAWMPSVLLLTDKYETSSMFYSLAYSHREDFVMGASRAKNLNLSKAFKVKKYPTLVAFLPSSLSGATKDAEKYNDDYDVVKYTGPINKEKIIAWLAKLKANTQDANQVKKKKKRGRPAHSEF